MSIKPDPVGAAERADKVDRAGITAFRDMTLLQPAWQLMGALTMKRKSRESKVVEDSPNGDDQIVAYSQAQPLPFRAICAALRELIDTALPKATSKVWHGSPVWFIDDNPVVGYNATAKSVNLLFWNGQAIDESGLKAVGKYRAAQAMFADAAEIDLKVIRRWLKKAKSDIFDSTGFF